MKYYLNRGLILEQVICNLIHEYLDSIRTDSLYRNFHVEVTNDHPFANLYMHNHTRTADLFPAIVVTTSSEDKPSDFINLAPEITGIGFDKNDVKDWASDTYDSDFTDDNGNVCKAGEKIPGLCAVTSQDVIDELNSILDKKPYIYGYKTELRRTDHISIEIWADNVQLKNELYESVRLFVMGSLRHILTERYNFFDPHIEDYTIKGQRSNNYNLEFDVPLAGGQITLDVNYLICQVLLDTDIEDLSDLEIITEVNNYVKD